MSLSTRTFIGPPGTGKTTRLLEMVETLVNEKVSPGRLGFVSFTRQAVQEAASRIEQEMEELDYFRTVHSMCFRLSGLSTIDVMQPEHYRELGEALGLDLTGNLAKRRTLEDLDRGDIALSIVELSRATLVNLRQTWETCGAVETVDWLLVDLVARGLAKYKKENGLVDYAGMLELYLHKGTVPPLQVLFVDEAQDLSPLQWAVIEKMSSGCDELIIAGDDDQAIHHWAGARPERFIRMTERGELTVLDKSYRLPRSVYNLARQIAGAIERRIPKQFAPRDADGCVDFRSSLDDLDLSEGEWLIMYRNRYMAAEAVEYCRQAGYHYECFLDDSSSSVRQAFAWEALRTGGSLPVTEVDEVLDLVGSKNYSRRGWAKLRAITNVPITMDALRTEAGLKVSGPWYEALVRLRQDETEYIRAMLRRGEKLRSKPRIRIDTIHGAKGSESQNVVLATDLSYRTYRGLTEGSEEEVNSELRVFYVGVTRAKENLFILEPKTPYSFNLGELA